MNSDKITFSEFTTKYLEQKKTSLSPTTYVFYEMIIRTELIPMFGTMKMRDIKTYHVQQFIQYLATEKKRNDGVEGGISATTVRRYTTVLRSILTLAYKLDYIDHLSQPNLFQCIEQGIHHMQQQVSLGIAAE